jgi:peptidoglycan/LPS O-acetylase OafA/YrhL
MRFPVRLPKSWAYWQRHPPGAGRGASPENPQRFVFVDALRGIAAMSVVLYHAFEAKQVANLELELPKWTGQLIHHGYLGVAIFFVLSGFVIAHSVDRRRVDASYVGWFVIRRSVRLDPPYWAAILLTIAVGVQAGTPTHPTVLAHLIYVQDLLQLEPISPIYWTLCLEMQLYVVFAVLLGIAHHFQSSRTDRRSLLIIFTAAALVAAVFPVGLVYEETLPAGLFLPKWYAFLVGTFAYWAIDGTIRRSSFYVYAGALFADAVLVHNLDAVVSIAVGASLLEVGRAGRLRSWLNWRSLQFLGTVSYSLYLLHGPITATTLRYTLYRLTPRTASWELLWLMVGLAMSCIGAWFFWRLVERPCVILARRCRSDARSLERPVHARRRIEPVDA